MKTLSITIVFTCCTVLQLQAQKSWLLGAGYFGSGNQSHGGLIELEYEIFQSTRLSTVNRLDIGFYLGPDQDVVYTDLHRGYRFSITEKWYAEQSFGLGMMVSFYSDVPVYEAENGNAGYFPNGRGIDLLPSISFGTGYRINGKNGYISSIWVRPKIYWQIPFHLPSQPNFGLQVGYTHML
jgi:hypothetical protein